MYRKLLIYVLDIFNFMLEKNNNVLLAQEKKKQNITFLTYIYVIVIAVIFITIGMIFPNDFTFFNIPGLGVIHYIVILYLFAAIGFLYKNKHYCTSNMIMKRKKGD